MRLSFSIGGGCPPSTMAALGSLVSSSLSSGACRPPSRATSLACISSAGGIAGPSAHGSASQVPSHSSSSNEPSSVRGATLWWPCWASIPWGGSDKESKGAASSAPEIAISSPQPTTTPVLTPSRGGEERGSLPSPLSSSGGTAEGKRVLLPLLKAAPRVLSPEEIAERDAMLRMVEEEEGSETTEPFDVLRNVDKSSLRCGQRMVQRHLV